MGSGTIGIGAIRPAGSAELTVEVMSVVQANTKMYECCGMNIGILERH